MKIGGFHPPEFGNLDRLRFAIDDSAIKEVKVDGLCRIAMDCCVVFVLNLCVYAQLFAKFSLQRGNQGLAGLNLAAGKLPHVAEVSIWLASREKDLIVSFDNCGRYCYHEESIHARSGGSV